MKIDGYREEVARLSEMLDQVERFTDAPEELLVVVHLSSSKTAVNFDAQTVDEVKARLAIARAYLRENLGEWTDEVTSIYKIDSILITFGNGSRFEITMRTKSEDVLRLYTKDGCEFVEMGGNSVLALTCPV